MKVWFVQVFTVFLKIILSDAKLKPNDSNLLFLDDIEKEKIDETETKEPEKKPLPDLDKYWKAVNDDPTDFTAWTYLLQYVDQEVRFQSTTIHST